jgi:uncharacterized protein YndB with AHSA1/START domain
MHSGRQRPKVTGLARRRVGHGDLPYHLHDIDSSGQHEAIIQHICSLVNTIIWARIVPTPGLRSSTVPRTDQASLIVEAPIDRTYAALVDPGALVEWLPPDGMSGRFEHFDLRPGGGYRMVLTYDTPSEAAKTTADSDVVDVRFVDIVSGQRVVQAVDFVSDDPRFAGTMTMTWAVSPVGDGTRVDIRADDVPDGISAEDHATGLRSSLGNLAAYLSR